jgi:hypothetical protein
VGLGDRIDHRINEPFGGVRSKPAPGGHEAGTRVQTAQ